MSALLTINPADDDERTAHRSDGAYRIYHRMLNWMVRHSDDGCSMTFREAQIAELLGESEERVNAALNELMRPERPMFAIEGSRLVCVFLRRK